MNLLFDSNVFFLLRSSLICLAIVRVITLVTIYVYNWKYIFITVYNKMVIYIFLYSHTNDIFHQLTENLKYAIHLFKNCVQYFPSRKTTHSTIKNMAL